MDSRPSSVAVALLCETPGLGAHMRDALAQLGAAVVYDEATHAFNRDALVRSRAKVVVVNLDAQNDPDLDGIYDLLGEGHYRVIFNDGDVSSALSGWDHARWLRHLAAKIHGGAADIDPPRPPGAEPVPMHGPHVADTDVQIPAAVAPSRKVAPQPEPASANDHQRDHQTNELDQGVDHEVDAQADHDLDHGVSHELIDHGFERTHEAVPAAADDALESIDFGHPHEEEPSVLADSMAAAPAAIAAHEVDAPAVSGDAIIDYGTMDLDADDLLDIEAVPEVMDDVEDPAEATPIAFHLDDESDFNVAFDDDSAAIDATTAGASVDGGNLDFAVDDALVVGDRSVAVPPLAPDWTLDDLVELPPAPTASPSITAARPAEFGIETMRAEEFLAPVTDAGAGHFDAPAESALELIPLEDAVAPIPIETEGRESWLDSAAGSARKIRIQRIWVLGASIGGPESVREFLALIPRDFPALFLVAQHLGDEFVDLMIQQLAKATPLTVHVAGHGDRASHGEVLIVPTSQRLLVGEDGVVVLERDQEERAFSPSIDRVLHDTADRFGANAGAIIFSGMSDDAAEGCRYLAGKGGRVYAQEPDTCVISSMIDGVCETGVVAFLGSPRELADKVLDERD